MQQIIHNIPLIAESQKGQSLAASLTMMFSWKSGESQDISIYVKKLQDKDLAEDNNKEIKERFVALAKQEGMTILKELPKKINDLAQIIFQSPVLVIFYSKTDESLQYAIVISGVMGDGSMTESNVHINDPDLASGGKKYKVPIIDLYSHFNKVVGSNDKLDLDETGSFFFYFDSSPKMNITSTHTSFSSRSSSESSGFEWNN